MQLHCTVVLRQVEARLGVGQRLEHVPPAPLAADDELHGKDAGGGVRAGAVLADGRHEARGLDHGLACKVVQSHPFIMVRGGS